MATRRNTGFYIDAPYPIDGRMRVNTFSDLSAIPIKYDRMLTHVVDEDKDYRYYVDTNTWEPLNYSGATSWGSITGDINAQTDLINKFNNYALVGHTHPQQPPLAHTHETVDILDDGLGNVIWDRNLVATDFILVGSSDSEEEVIDRTWILTDGTNTSDIASNTTVLFSGFSFDPANKIVTYDETDPTVPDYVKAISSSDISNWNNAYAGLIYKADKTYVDAQDAALDHRIDLLENPDRVVKYGDLTFSGMSILIDPKEFEWVVGGIYTSDSPEVVLGELEMTPCDAGNYRFVLLQGNSDGTYSIREGLQSSTVAEIPTPDEGTIALVAIHVFESTPLGYEDVLSDLDERFNLKEDKANKGVADGYAPLDNNVKIPLEYINDALLGNVNWKGLYDGSIITSSPDPSLIGQPLPLPTPINKGWYFISTGDYTYSGIDFKTGDWIISSGNTWDKVDNTDAVSSVFGRTGNITAQDGDYTASQITNVPSGSISSVTVQAALNELATEKAPSAGSANYIQNRFITPQTADIWISGMAQIGQHLHLRRDGGSSINVVNFEGSTNVPLTINASYTYFNNGNVGIRVINPTEVLEVNGNAKANSFIKSGAPTTNILLAGGSDIPQSTFVPSTRTISINGVTQDLSANRSYRAGLSNTGALTYSGSSVASTTTINIGAVTGIITNNETNPAIPSYQLVTYAGATNVTVPTIASGTGTYVLLNSAGTIVFQNTFPTSAQRKSMIYLSKISHPNLSTISFVIDEPDFVNSPLQQFRDLFQVIQYMNQGITISGNADLTINSTNGSILGDGINFVLDKTNPNMLSIASGAPRDFLLLNQSGAVGSFTNTIDPANYDVAGVTTPIGGSTNNTTIQYLYYAPGVGFAILRGQTVYPTLLEAVSAVGRESFVLRPNLVNNSILIAAICLRRTTTAMNDTSFVRILLADKFGQIGGASSGISVTNLQTAYNNSLVPQITTTSTLGAVTLRNGGSSDNSGVFAIQNIAGTTTASINGLGAFTGTSWNGYIPANDSLVVHKAETETITGIKTFSALTNFNDHVRLAPNITSSGGSITSASPLFTTVGNNISVFSAKVSGHGAAFDTNILTNNRTFTFPNTSGTFALTSDFPTLAIQNQNASAQSANMWISGKATIGAINTADIWAGYTAKIQVGQMNYLDYSVTPQGVINFNSYSDGTDVKRINTGGAVSLAWANNGDFTIDSDISRAAGTAASLTNKLKISAATGNVGIGSTSPSKKLEIVSSINSDGINFKYNSSFGNMGLGTVFDSVNDFGNVLQLFVNNAAGTATERMRIQGNGRVGIDTNNPFSKFVVSDGGGRGIEFDPVIGEIFCFNRTTTVYDPLYFSASKFSFLQGNVLVGTQTDSTLAKLIVAGPIMSNIVSGSATGIVSDGGTSIKLYHSGEVRYGIGVNVIGGIDYMANQADAASSHRFYGGADNNGTPRKILELMGTGVVKIPNLADSGTRTVVADAGGNLSAPVSDISLKENIQPLHYGLNEVMKMNPVSYNFKDKKRYGEGLYLGNIAQDMEKIIPEAVFTDNNTGKMGIEYSHMHAVYIKAIQELLLRIEKLETK